MKFLKEQSGVKQYEAETCQDVYVTDEKHITPWLVVCKRTIPTERPPLVSEASANFCGGQRNGSPRPLISVFKTGDEKHWVIKILSL
jgi:hypothetical protein